MKWDELQKGHYYVGHNGSSIILFHFNGNIEDASGHNHPVKRIECYSLMHVGVRVKSYVRDAIIIVSLDEEFKEIAEDDYLKLMKLRKMFESVVFPLIKQLVKN